MFKDLANTLYYSAQQATRLLAPVVGCIAQSGPQFLLMDFKLQKVYFGAMTLLQGSLGLVQSHLTDRIWSCFTQREVKPIQYDLAMTSLILVAGGTFLLYDAIGEFLSIYSLHSDASVMNAKNAFPMQFAEEHRNELEHLCQHKSEIGSWKKLSEGAHKIVFTHPELPEHVVKIPGTNIIPGLRLSEKDEKLIAHYQNAQIAREIITTRGHKHLVVPNMHLLKTACPIVLEEKFEFKTMTEFNSDMPKTAAENELDDFVRESGFGDTILRFCRNLGGVTYCGHNARFIKDTEDEPKIAIFDFDSRD